MHYHDYRSVQLILLSLLVSHPVNHYNKWFFSRLLLPFNTVRCLHFDSRRCEICWVCCVCLWPLHRGNMTLQFCRGGVDFVLCLADDRMDEDVFTVLRDYKFGAQYRIYQGQCAWSCETVLPRTEQRKERTWLSVSHTFPRWNRQSLLRQR